MQPVLFISHGSPMTILQDTPARHFLATLATHLPRPQAILCVSAHWETAVPAVSDPPANETIHDFYGFPAALYAQAYTPPVAHKLAARTATLLRQSGLLCETDHARGLDHGAWVPLKLAWPDESIPVIQLSIQPGATPAQHISLGAALLPLREEGVLVIGSGTFTHDLSRFRGGRPDLDTPETPDVIAFADWMDEKIMARDFAALAHYRRLAPYAAAEHPTEDHILPLFVALGAATAEAEVTRLHSSVEYGFMRMDAYKFG